MYIIIGASSLIGRNLYGYLKKQKREVLGTFYSNSENEELIKFDICNDSILKLVEQYITSNIAAIIICGANANIDSCKKNEKSSYELNVKGTQKLIDEIKQLNTKCVFLSSEAVFDGERGRECEEDTPNPITVYGKQKLLIEKYIMQELKDYIIFRLSRVIGNHFGEKDIFNDFYTRILKNEEISCLKDMSFCLTDIEDVSKIIISAVEKNICGLYHLSSNNHISRYDLANRYADMIFGGYSKIIEKEYEEIPFLDRRAVKGGLNGNRIVQLLELQYNSLDNILDRYFQDFKSTEKGRKGYA